MTQDTQDGELVEDHDEKKSLKQKLGDRMHPPPSAAAALAAQHEALALETLVALLKSENESIRLQAAHILLDRPKPAAPTPPAKVALEKVKKVIL